jgi:diadenosine tetraphosphatase ApaH/serine/threonine PP2A family protein phosphatase
MTKPTNTPRKPIANSPYNFFAVISDIHANIDALEAVLNDIREFPVRGILCLGDIVGYGPEPAACVRKVMEQCAVTVLGNHEAMLLLTDKILADDWGATVGKPLFLAREQLTSEELGWVKELPLTVDLDPITLSHASLNEPAEFNYLHDQTEADAHFAAQRTFIGFNGHTHVPVLWEENPEDFSSRSLDIGSKPVRLNPEKRYTMNVGSVGQPRDNDPRASYVLYDHETRVLLHRRVPYDLKKAQARFKKAGLPAHNSSRLAKGE